MRVHDKRLGIIHFAMIFLILCYSGLYVFYYKQGYYETEDSSGLVALKVKGDSYSIGSDGEAVIWTSEDLIQPPVEANALFVASGIYLTSNQARGTCAIPGNNCTQNSDCKKSYPAYPGICGPDGFCMMKQWCPAENITADGHPTVVTEQSNIVSADVLTIWMKASIGFPELRGNRNYSTVFQDNPVPAPSPFRNLFSVGDLLRMTDTRYEDIAQRGCIVLVRLKWNCYLDSADTCFPVVESARLDNRTVKTGFNVRFPSYYRDANSTLHRDLFKYVGIRFFFVSEGVGHIVSPSAIMLQLSSCLAMLAVATAITDFTMQHVMPQRKKYTKYKFMEVRAPS